MKQRTKLLLHLSVLTLNVAFAQEKEEKTYLELPWIEVVPIKDTQNDRQYELYIRVPPGYSAESDTAHPVLYFTDALWHVEILSSSAEYLLEDAILVGISWQKDIDEELVKEVGQHVSRHRDYSVSPSTKPELQAKYQFGGAGDHLAFIRNEVIPYVETNYNADPARRTYFGYSTGGLFGAYILMAQPDTFKNYIIGSPSLWRDIPLLTELAANKALNSNVFISHGDLEDRLAPLMEEFVTMLKNRNDASLKLQHEVIAGTHQTAFPLTSIRGVTWLGEVMGE